MQNDFSHLEPDYYEDSGEEDILASFPSLRSKTFETLYGGCGDDEQGAGGAPSLRRRRDKSPKGSVDEPIQELVDLINSHPSFTTLSSCSGRIALFDPLLARNSSSSLPSTTTTAAHQQQPDRPITADSSIEQDERSNVDSRSSAARSGKGGTGGWLLAAHHVVEPTILVDLLDDDNQHSETAATSKEEQHDDGDDDDNDDNNVLSFKMEPLLLHVAAANLTRGRQLLQIALQAAGLRESGLVVTESRVTVALRGQSLALCLPLARRKNSPLRPNDEYLVALAQEANRRLRRNFEKIQRLFQAVQSQMFRPKRSPAVSMGQDHYIHGTTSAPAASTCRIIRASPLPALNLWRHASVLVPSHTSSADNEDFLDMDLLVFGGYGRGPTTDIDVNSSTTAPARRSDKVYRLRRNAQGSWSDAWEEMTLDNTDDPVKGLGANPTLTDGGKQQNSLGLSVRKVEFTAREGLAACLLSYHAISSSSSISLTSSLYKNIIALFGGRQGPNRPFNELLFFDNNSFHAPMDVRGSVPAARWGHSFTSVSSSSDETNQNDDSRPIALVVGGRTDSQTFASVHVLSIVVVQEKEAVKSLATTTTASHLVWSEVITQTVNPSYCPRFYHSATTASHNQTFVFGGLENAQHLLGTDDKDESSSTGGLVVDTTRVDPLPGSPLDDFFGHSVSLLPIVLQPDQATEDGAVVSDDSYTFLSIGGISREASENDDDHDHGDCSTFRCVTLRPSIAETIVGNRDTSKKDRQQQQSKWSVQEHVVHAADIDLGCVVHHSCAVAPTRNPNEFQVLVVGGGVQGFAFGPIFAKSHVLTVRLSIGMQQQESKDGQEAHISTGRSSVTTTSADRGPGRVQSHSGTQVQRTIAPPKNGDNKQRETNVLYVTKQDAKTAKNLLEEAHLLDKQYRMIPATIPAFKTENEDSSQQQETDTGTTCIAVPVTLECIALLENKQQSSSSPSSSPLLVDSLKSLLQGSGRQEMPYSTAVFASRKKKKASN